MSKDPIVFDKDKDLGGVLSDSINFFWYNFRGLMRIALLYGLPFAFLLLLLFFVLSNDFFSSMTFDDDFDRSAFFSMGFYIVLSFLQGVVLSSAYIAYIRLYRSGTDHITDADVWMNFKKVIPSVIGISVLSGLGLGILPGLGILFIELGLMVLGGILFVLALPAVIYLMVPGSLLYYSWPAEGGSLGRQISYVFRLISGRWLWSFGLLFIMFIMVSVAAQVITLPIQAMMFSEAISSSSFDTVNIMFYQKLQYVASLFGNVILSAYLIPAIALIYHSLVQRREQTELRERIAHIGAEKSGISDEQE